MTDRLDKFLENFTSELAKDVARNVALMLRCNFPDLNVSYVDDGIGTRKIVFTARNFNVHVEVVDGIIGMEA